MESAKDTLIRLLAENREKYHVEFRSYLSNHMAMALISLYQMGSSAERLKEYFEFYSARLVPSIPSTQYINASNWNQFLGQKKFYNDYREFFSAERQRLGGSTRELLSLYLPLLMEGVIGGAFHPILMVGYGVEILDFESELVIDGLAYLAYAFKSLGTLPAINPRTKKLFPKEILKRVFNEHSRRADYSDKQLDFPTKVNLLAAKEKDTLDKYDRLRIDTLSDTNDILDKIGISVVNLFSSTQDFFVLHGVTGLYAFKQAITCINPTDKTMAIRYFWRALVGIYILQGQPSVRPVNIKSWEKALTDLTRIPF